MTGSAPRRDPLLRRLLIGLGAGVALGLFLGDAARVFDAPADGFIKLLQMAVLPYVTVSIIGTIGALRVEDLRALGLRAALVMVSLWGIALAFAFLMPLTFPPTESAAFFSTTLLEPRQPFDLVDLYIPANPFFALANNIVPAVVLFSMVVGVALMGVPQKHVLLSVLEVASATLSRAMRFVVRLTPYGMFAVAAKTAGTLRLEQAGRLEIYLIAYGAFALLIALWVLPGLVSALTPIPAREIFAETRGALITAAIAGDVFIVLPMLITATRELAMRHAPDTYAAHASPDVIVPVSYNFPHTGKLLSVSFILFAGWFSDAAIPASDYPRLGLTALVTLFGSVTSAMPFLLDLFHVPADTFQLFLASGVINSRFGSLVSAMHTVTVALLGTCAVAGALRWQPRRLARFVVITAVLTAAVIGGVRLLGATIVGHPDAAGDVLAAMRVDPQAAAEVIRTAAPAAAVAATDRDPVPAPADGRLDEIRQRGVLRVGYLPDALPFAFFNGRDELVGFDVALVHRLALELGVRLVFVPIAPGSLETADGAADRLRRGDCDLVLGGMVVTTARAGLMELSTRYLDETLGFVVRDGDRTRFESWEAIREAGPITVAVPDLPYYVEKLQRRLPEARLQRVASIAALFDAAAAGADAIGLPAERGSAWTLRFPRYSVVVPMPDPIKVPLAIGMPRGEPALSAFVNTWLDLKRRDGTLDELYRYWILGRDATPLQPRWSILRNVLHWVK